MPRSSDVRLLLRLGKTRTTIKREDVYRRVVSYIFVLLVLGAGTLAAILYGARLYHDQAAVDQLRGLSTAGAHASPQQNQQPASPDDPSKTFKGDARAPFSVLLLQIIAIIAVARLVGTLIRRMGQPAVIGEMIAGILLGSSVLGALSPQAMTYLFPPQSLEVLKLLSQLGVIVFMFVVGMEVDLQHLCSKAHAVVLVSHASIMAPIFLGAVFSIFIYPATAPADISFSAFALFMSVAMSITAFPVLARILEERGLTETYLGNTAIACAAVDDATAWCLLAVVVAVVKSDGLSSVILGLVAVILFIGVMLFLLKPLAERFFPYDDESKTPDRKSVPAAMLLLFVSALFTEAIGIHALFGAFLAGVVMPAHANLRKLLTERMGGFTGLLLPIFFAFTGLRTQINLLDGWWDWMVCAGVIMIAITGKLGGSMLAARWSGMSWHESISLGVLMNTRGLIELVVLNIGYDLGILSPRIFSMMVIMALVTTFMTSPLFSLLNRWEQKGVPEGVQKAVA